MREVLPGMQGTGIGRPGRRAAAHHRANREERILIMVINTIPNLADVDSKLMGFINTLVRDHSIPAADAACIALEIYGHGFNTGRDAALKSSVEIMETLAIGYNPAANLER